MIAKTELPQQSILNLDKAKYDYIDSFVGILNDKNNTLTSTQLGKAFFVYSPNWVGKLFSLRNKIVSLFGLKTSGKMTKREQQLNNFRCEVGEQLGLFKIFHKTENEVVMGEDDRHLNFRVSLFFTPSNLDINKTEVFISTTVEFNNWFGKLYFLPVKIFHKIIVPVMLKSTIDNLEK
ncbi:DUF2867 domain-containing protein [Bernardetia sp. OM2101]|uniref:DUF2867 domain-containing protein n=1 Tax=Bernardetia sp. OM2101 TaxID=3344876 RepID=UPI0035D0CB75